jgi:hypothetical protein
VEPRGPEAPEPAAPGGSFESIRWPPRKPGRVEPPAPDAPSDGAGGDAEAAYESRDVDEPDAAIPAEPSVEAEPDPTARAEAPAEVELAPHARAEAPAEAEPEPTTSIAATAAEPEPATAAGPADERPAFTPAAPPGWAATKPATAARVLDRVMSWRGSRAGRLEEDERADGAEAPPSTAISPADTDGEPSAGELDAASAARAKARRIKWIHAEPGPAPARPEAAEPRPPAQDRADRAKARLIKRTHAEPSAAPAPAERAEASAVPAPAERAEPEPLTQAHAAPAELAPAPEPAAVASTLTEPHSLTETPALPDAPLTFRERGRLRQRARYLRRLREVQIRDLGGFVLELHRFDTWRGDLVGVKLAAVAETDRELRALESVLDERRSLQEVREAGIGGACRQCGTIYGSVDRFCAACGVSLEDADAGTGAAGAGTGVGAGVPPAGAGTGAGAGGRPEGRTPSPRGRKAR